MRGVVLALGGVMLLGCGAPAPAPAVEARSTTGAGFVCVADHRTAPLDGSLRLPACNDAPARCEADCEAGDADACWLAAQALERDPATEERGAHAYRRGCQLGHANACTNHGAKLWSSADPKSAEFDCALRVFVASCPLGDHFACGMIGRLHAERDQPGDRAAAAEVLERTCFSDLGGFPCRVLALLRERGVLAGDASRPTLEQLMQRACEGGDPGGCGELTTVDASFGD